MHRKEPSKDCQARRLLSEDYPNIITSFSSCFFARTTRDPIVILRIITARSHLLLHYQQVPLPIVREELRIWLRREETSLASATEEIRNVQLLARSSSIGLPILCFCGRYRALRVFFPGKNGRTRQRKRTKER